MPNIPCVFGEEICADCPVLRAMSLQSHIESSSPAGMNPQFKMLQKQMQMMFKSVQNPLNQVVAFCKACPFPEIYVRKQVCPKARFEKWFRRHLKK